MASRWLGYSGLWALFFLICCGLGFPAAARYDPRLTQGTNDSRTYLTMVESGPPYPAGEDYNRVLIPVMAKPVYWLARGRVGSWDAAATAMLIVNSGMVATAALLLLVLTMAVTGAPSAGLIAALLLLVNFTTANTYLAGVVDAGELCALMGVTSAMWFRRWWWLPLLGLLGAAAKETFVLLAVLLVGGWVVGSRCDPANSRAAAWAMTMVVTALATMVVLLSWNRGHLFWPWNLAGDMASSGATTAGSLAGRAVRVIFSRGFLYTFGWLLPLGMWRLARIPRSWLLGSALAVAGALAISVFSDARDNAGRIAFIVAGPPLCLSAAVLVTDVMQRLQVGSADGRSPPRQ